MTLTIGRCSGLRPAKFSPSQSGGRLSISGYIIATTADELRVRRQQLLGLVDNADEEIVPLVWLSDSTFDGFYRPVSADVRLAGSVGSKRAVFNVELERLTGYANPWFEVTTMSVVRTNAHGITAPASAIYTFPTVSAGYQREYELPSAFASGSAVSRYIADNPGGVVEGATLAAPVALTAFRFTLPPSTYYFGAARVEVLYGDTWYPVVGRDVKRVSRWRISNGCVRLTSANAATAGTFEVWSGSAWVSVTNVTHSQAASLSLGIGFGSGAVQGSLTILQNTPECVVVRTSGNGGSLTYSLQRAAHLVSVSWTFDSAAQAGIAFSSTTACTAVDTSTIRATSNDTSGNRLVMGVAVANTQDLVNGKIYPSVAATSGAHFIGVEFDGSSSAGTNQASKIRDQWFGAVSWRQRVIVR